MNLPQGFFTQGAETLAPALLGKVICRRTNGEVLRAVITETECYLGEGDTASHASRGKTPRNSVMFARGGHLYVYLCYGMHYLLNIVSGKAGNAEAVLIRGITPYDDIHATENSPPLWRGGCAQRRRGGLIGPGKVTKYLGITKTLNAVDVTASDEIWIEDNGITPQYTTKPRVGIAYAAPADRERPWRFCAEIT